MVSVPLSFAVCALYSCYAPFIWRKMVSCYCIALSSSLSLSFLLLLKLPMAINVARLFQIHLRYQIFYGLFELDSCRYVFSSTFVVC